jgi:hypothetical protein
MAAPILTQVPWPKGRYLSLEHTSSSMMSPRYAKYDEEAGQGRRGVKHGAGANSDVILESKLEFEYFGNSVQTYIHTAYCTYACYVAIS